MNLSSFQYLEARIVVSCVVGFFHLLFKMPVLFYILSSLKVMSEPLHMLELAKPSVSSASGLFWRSWAIIS